MGYKTILVHADLSSHAPERIRRAADLARQQGAHLLGAAMLGISRDVFPCGYDMKPGTLASSCFDPMAGNARRALDQFERIAGESGVPHAARFVCDQADNGLARMARFADLVVISQDDPQESMPDRAMHTQEYVILNGARPVFMVPRIDTARASRAALLAWNGSKEASAALLASVPLLQHAAEAAIVAITGPDADEAEFAAQAPDLTDFLARHGIAARVLVREPVLDVGRDLLGVVRELDCGLLVMGCYGRTRFRELCLGGASRTVLADASVPVLFVH